MVVSPIKIFTPAPAIFWDILYRVQFVIPIPSLLRNRHFCQKIHKYHFTLQFMVMVKVVEDILLLWSFILSNRPKKHHIYSFLMLYGNGSSMTYVSTHSH